MQRRQLLVLTIGILAMVTGLAACESKPPEAKPVPKMSNDELDRLVTAKINSDAALPAVQLFI